MAVWNNIFISQLVGAVRLDAEFWQPTYLQKEQLIRSGNHASLGSLVSVFKKGIFYILAREYAPTGVPFYRSSNVGAILPKDEGLAYITEVKHSKEYKTSLVYGDLLIVKTGKSGASVVIRDRCNVSQDVIATKVKRDKVNPFYLAVYLNTHFGSSEMNRWFQGQVQPHLSLDDARKIWIALVSDIQQKKIEELVVASAETSSEANRAWTDAQQLLDTELGLDKFSFQKSVGYTAQFSELEQSRRLDADHFYPEFDFMLSQVPPGTPFVRLAPDLTFCQRGTQPIYATSDKLVVNSKHVQPNHVILQGNRTALPNPVASMNIQPGDLLLNGTGVGTIGRAAPYLNSKEAVPDNHVTMIRTRNLDPVYLSVFLNSRIGQAQVRKYQRGSSGQIELYPNDIAKFQVWNAPVAIQQEIRRLVIAAHEAQQRSKSLLEEAKTRVEQLIEAAVQA